LIVEYKISCGKTGKQIYVSEAMAMGCTYGIWDKKLLFVTEFCG